MTEIRAISRGLVLPEVADLPAQQIIRLAAQSHQARSGQPVSLRIDDDCPMPLTPALRICLFRFVQEGLNNASRHAAGSNQWVVLICSAGLRLAVRDDGPGLAEGSVPGLGLGGLRDRVEALGGRFGLDRKDGHTELWMEVTP